jgi:hypothetical protein
MPLKIRTMVHHNLRGRPLQTRMDIHAEEGKEEGEDNIIFPRRTVCLLKIQVTSRPIPMDSTHTWPLIPHNWSKTCNETMSMRILSFITCWCNNGKQLLYGRVNLGRVHGPIIRGYHSCLTLSVIWLTSFG